VENFPQSLDMKTRDIVAEKLLCQNSDEAGVSLDPMENFPHGRTVDIVADK